MTYMGFGRKWISLIHECISGSKLAILINGSQSPEFIAQRGLRQVLYAWTIDYFQSRQ
jgi:hypothetical protein